MIEGFVGLLIISITAGILFMFRTKIKIYLVNKATERTTKKVKTTLARAQKLLDETKQRNRDIATNPYESMFINMSSYTDTLQSQLEQRKQAMREWERKHVYDRLKYSDRIDGDSF